MFEKTKSKQKWGRGWPTLKTYTNKIEQLDRIMKDLDEQRQIELSKIDRWTETDKIEKWTENWKHV